MNKPPTWIMGTPAGDHPPIACSCDDTTVSEIADGEWVKWSDVKHLFGDDMAHTDKHLHALGDKYIPYVYR